MEYDKDLKELRLMIANRGEIAIRIARAASELGIVTVGLYTFEDRFSQHRYKTDEAYQIGPNDEALKPYIDISTIIKVAKREKIDLIHPGYGFLSENAEFAKACAEAGIIFIGPRPDILTDLGDKINAKVIAKKLQIPVIEDIAVQGEISEDNLALAEKIGYPLLIKSSGGGGGRGMRLVENAEKLQQLASEASIEASKSFGSSTIFIEKYIHAPKHIEVQLLGDNHGNLVHLYERDCSVQRRYQKVVEIAPAVSETNEVREKLHQYALQIGKELSYNNAGTVEFLVDSAGQIFFIEINPRVQVEHTVTEEITAIDIVRSQILIALNYDMHQHPVNIPKQELIGCNGVALQCRVTTEDPAHGFKPDYGTVSAYRSAGGYGIRLDECGIFSGMKISPYFDPMIVKVTAKGRSLWSTCQRMSRALQEFRIRGVQTNIGFLLRVIDNEEFQQGLARVNFIEKFPSLLDIEPLQDSSSKTLVYLGDVIINGCPDVAGKNRKIRFATPPLPQSTDLFSAPKAGSRDKFKQLGRAAFCDWLLATNEIQYTDTTLRDAHQSLFATRLRTLDMLKVAPHIARNLPEIFSMEVWGGATFDVALRFLKEDPWQRLKLLRQEFPNILFQMLFRGANGVGYSAYPNNLIECFIDKASENGIEIFRIFDSLNYLPNMENSVKHVVKNTDKIAEASICYTGDILDKERTKYSLNYYLDLAKQLEDMGSHILAIKDMAGLLTPLAAELLITKLKETIKIPIHLHTHDTSSVQSTTYLKAIEAGVDVVDVAISSMSGLTSQPNFNSIVNMLKYHPRANPMSSESLNEISNYFEVVRDYYYPFETDMRSGTAEVYANEIPGGQYSNLRSQARALGMEDQFGLIKKNYINANRMLGDIVKVTPSSKVVGDLALFLTTNSLTPEDVMQRGHELSFPDSVINFLKGDLGQPPGGFDPKLQKIILKDIEAYTALPNSKLAPTAIDAEFAEFQKKYSVANSFLDFLSFKLYPKVFDEYNKFYSNNGSVYKIPTENFFYGIGVGQQIVVELQPGKEISIEYIHVSEPDDEGLRNIIFRLNGVARSLRIKDNNVKSLIEAHQKVDKANAAEIGAPLQGKLTNIAVKVGDTLAPNQPIFAIEAMKMETTVTAAKAGKIAKIHHKIGVLVQVDDLIITLE